MATGKATKNKMKTKLQQNNKNISASAYGQHTLFKEERRRKRRQFENVTTPLALGGGGGGCKLFHFLLQKATQERLPNSNESITSLPSDDYDCNGNALALKKKRQANCLLIRRR